MEQCWKKPSGAVAVWLTQHDCALHGLALVCGVSCSGTVDIQKGLFKIINPISAVSNSNSTCAIQLGENGL